MSERTGIIYGLVSRPPFPGTVVLALQHVLTMFGATVLIPFIVGDIIKVVLAAAAARGILPKLPYSREADKSKA